MNEDLHNEKLPVTAEDGWKQMQELLDKHLPVQEPVIYKSKLMPYAAVALLIFMLVVTSILLNESIFKPIAGIKASTDAIDDKVELNKPLVSGNDTEKAIKPVSASPLTSSSAAAARASVVVSHPAKNTDRVHHASGENKMTTAANANLNTTASEIDKAATKIAEERTTETSEEKSEVKKALTDEIADEPAATADSSKEQSLAEKPLLAKKRAKNSNWNFYAGLGVNITGSGGAQNLHPYPMAEAKYTITPLLYVSAGLSLYAPVATNTITRGKPVYINDTVSNIRMYNEKLSYRQFHYLDIPVSVGMNITKHLSVQSGVQLSLLLNEKNEKSIDQYDFQMNNVRVPVFTSLTSLRPTPPVEEEVKLSKTDVRFQAGLKYNLQRFSAGVTYQQGLRPVISGNMADGKKNNVFALSLLYRIK